MSDPNLTGRPKLNYFPQQQAKQPNAYGAPNDPVSGYPGSRAQIMPENTHTYPYGPDPSTKPPVKMPKTIMDWIVAGSLALFVLFTILISASVASATIYPILHITIGWFIIMVPSTFRFNISLLISYIKVVAAGGTLVGLVSGHFVAITMGIAAGLHSVGFQERFPTIDRRATPPMWLRQAFWQVHSFASSAGAVFLGLKVFRWWHGGVLPEGSTELKVDPFWGAVCGAVGHLVWSAYGKYKASTQLPSEAPNQPPQPGLPPKNY